MKDGKIIFREVKGFSKTSFITAGMRRTRSSFYGADKKLVKQFA